MISKEKKAAYNSQYIKKNRDKLKEYRASHYTGLYGSWYAMKQRCSNQNNKQFMDYSGRGITYPEKWEGFDGFKADMGVSYSKGLTIERIDNSKNYSIENCRWATRKEQNNNKRSNIVLTLNGETHPIAIWAERMNLSFGTVRSRFYRGMDVQNILKPSLYRPAKRYTITT